MPSKQPDVAKYNISPVLFMTVDGEPMSFFLRPGAVKRKLQPLITAGAGMLCNVQKPGAILLIDPEDRGSIPESSAHWYVSTQYIHDCVEKNEQLNLEDYRLNPELIPRQSARLNNNKENSPGFSGGRIAYTADDDAAILNHVSKHKTEIGGNRLWQEMERQHVTCHSWQSMKYRYRVHLAKKQSKVVVEATTEGDTKIDVPSVPPENTQVEAEMSISPQEEVQHVNSQKDKQPPGSTHLETVVPEPSFPPQEELQHVNCQTDKQPPESTQVEAVESETSNSTLPEGPCLDLQTDAHPIPAKEPPPETEEPQTVISPQKEIMQEDSPPAPPESMPSTSPQKKPREKQKASPDREQLQRPSTRRKLVVELLSLPEPYAKKLRSSTTSPVRPPSSPRPSKKTKSDVTSALQKDTTVDQPPSKRARGTSETASPQEESGPAVLSEITQADTESNLVPQKGEKKKEKRKLGILELATKEFEDESESDEEEAPNLQKPTETSTKQPTSTEPPISTSDTAADRQTSAQSNPGARPMQETPVSGNCLPKTGDPESAATEPAASKAHLFIFDSESQEEESQSIGGNNPVASSKPQLTVNKDAALSLTQVQLEEDTRRIKELMNETNQNLASVTKALLRTSGDFSAARKQLLNPSSSISGPFWNRCDDSLLLSADPVVRRQLQEKYSEEEVAKRIMFLEVV